MESYPICVYVWNNHLFVFVNSESEMQTGTADMTHLDSTMTRPQLGKLEWLGWLSDSVKEMSRDVFTNCKLPHWKFHSHLMPGLVRLKNATQLGCQQKHLNRYALCDLGFPQHDSLETPKVSISVKKKNPYPFLNTPLKCISSIWTLSLFLP